MSRPTVPDLEAQWNEVKPQIGRGSPLDDSVDALKNLLAEVREAGSYTADAPDRANLQWMAREIGDTIFRLTGEYSTPFILPVAADNVDRETALHAPKMVRRPRVAISKLPVTGEHFVGREQELARLDSAWDDPATNVISFVAFGGVGKSTLVNRWLDRLATDDWRGAERVLGWSFYSQGTEATGASSEAFIEYALRWLGYEGDAIQSPWEKGAVLARLVRDWRTLLVLDGLEPLQHPPGAQTGRIRDPAVQALLRELAAENPGLCVISTRLAVADVAGRGGRRPSISRCCHRRLAQSFWAYWE